MPSTPASAPTMPTAPTAQWTPGIARGDRAAFGAFYEAWFDRALALARRTLRSDLEGAHDVVQDVMLRVARAMPVLRDERSVESWMARTIFTVAIDRLRARIRRDRHELQAHEIRDGAAPDALSTAALREQAEWLGARIAELPDADRDALRLRFAGDATLDEIGSILGISGHAAHGRIRRSLLRLRNAAIEVFGDGS